MMKKIFPVFAIASMMLATSCSNDDLSNLKEGTNSTVTFTAQLSNPLQSRAFADGKTATTLDYAVYEVKDGNWTLLPDLGKAEESINMSKTVSLNLVNGKQYAVVFWADAPSSIYTFDAANKNVTANYSAATCSNENYDAFYAVEEFTVNGTALRTVNLKRPFAQLNIGTSDLAAAKSSGIDVQKAGVTVKTYNTLNFKDGSVDGEEEVTFAAATLPEETFPVASAGCKYLTMNYLLMPTDKKADNAITISYDGAAEDRTFQNIPLQRNYRTNIYGTLLTSTNNFNVTITPAFNDPDAELIAWDGPLAKVVKPNAEGVYEINDSQELAWIAYQTRQGNTFAGKTVKLMDDIDLDGLAWKGIGSDNRQTDFPKYAFAGTFDGDGHSISNLNVTSYCYANDATAGLFNTVQGGAVIKNLTVKNATVTSTHYAGVIVGYNWFTNNSAATIENCTVENSTVTSTAELKTDGSGKYDNGDKVGGIVGYLCYGTVTGCTVKDTTMKAYRDLGGIVGCTGVMNSNQPSTISNNTINGVTLVIDKTNNYYNYTTKEAHNAGAFLGRLDSYASGTPSATLSNNTGTATVVYE